MSSLLKAPGLAFPAATTKTIATGVVTIDQNFHKIASEAGAADDLVTVNLDYDSLAFNGVTYWPLLFLIADAGDTITIKHGTGNFDLPGDGDATLSDDCWLLFIYNGTNWQTCP
jgi:hypothetical protein